MLLKVFVGVEGNRELLPAKEEICTKIMKQERILEIIAMCLEGRV